MIVGTKQTHYTFTVNYNDIQNQKLYGVLRKIVKGKESSNRGTPTKEPYSYDSFTAKSAGQF